VEGSREETSRSLRLGARLKATRGGRGKMVRFTSTHSAHTTDQYPHHWPWVNNKGAQAVIVAAMARRL
jgi:hypothetical protein